MRADSFRQPLANPAAAGVTAYAAIAVATCVLALLSAYAFACLPLTSLLRDWSSDDSFYYAQVARNLVARGRSSFDGLEPTNGYHPLWLFVQAPLHQWLEPVAALRATRMLEVAQALAGGLLLLSVLRRAGLGPASGLLVMVLLGKCAGLYEGLETGTLFLTLMLCLWALQAHAAAPTEARAHAVGVALLLVGLARLEAFALVPVVAWSAVSGAADRHHRLATLVRILAWPLVGAGIYAMVNLVSIGSAVPISGVVKAFWSARERGGPPSLSALVQHLLVLSRSGQVRDGLVYGLVFVIYLALRQRIGGSPSPARRALHGFVLALVGVHLARLVWFAWTTWPPFGSYEHYWITGRFLRFLVWMILLDVVLQWRRTPRAAARLGVVVVTLWAAWSLAGVVRQAAARAGDATLDWEAASYGGACWLRAHLPEAHFGSFDAGVIGHFGPDRVTNLDGLVASPAYVEAMRAGKADEAAWQRGVRYIANVMAVDTADIGAWLRWKWSLAHAPLGRFTLEHVEPARATVDGIAMEFRVYRWDR